MKEESKMSKQENTKNKIIEVATHLFLTKGYEATRISDIIKGLDGLTKGAVYHHFESKEDIFNAVVEQIGRRNEQLFDEIKYDKTLNGKEKLEKVISLASGNGNMDQIIEMSPNLLESPKLLATFMMELNTITIPQYLLPMIKEGIEDGSISSKYSIELAEMIGVLLHIWLNPLIFSNHNFCNKLRLLNDVLEQFNLRLFDEKFIQKLEALSK